MTIRRGVRLALDWGRARIGVAACDPDGILAYPVETIRADADPLHRLKDLVAEYRPIEIIMGLPRDLSGQHGIAAVAMEGIARQVSAQVAPIPVRLIDERLSTVSATRQLQQAGKKSRQQRAVIDQAAAVTILRHALSCEAAGRLPGHTVTNEPVHEGGQP